MKHINITREELENLYVHNGLSRKELRHLLRVLPNRIPEKLSELFRHELNPFMHSSQKSATVRGFLHSAPKKLLANFNKIHYELTSELGDYKLVLISSSPNELNTTIPLIVPKNVAPVRDLGKAHFSVVTGRIQDITSYKPKLDSGLFLIVNEIDLLGFTDLFSVAEPTISLTDFADMVRDRFNTTDLLTKGMIYWFMSSPVYEGRAGGNSFSPISPYEQQFKCEPKLLDLYQNELLSIPLPYFTQSKPKSVSFDYNGRIKANLKYFRSQALHYRYEPDLDIVEKFLNERAQSVKLNNTEINLSTTSLELDSIHTRPLETFVTKPLLPAKILTHTDMPILFTAEDLAIDSSETELLEYNIDINQLIYQANLSYPNSPYEHLDIAESVRKLMGEIRHQFHELHELMIEGIIFNPGYIGGLGEHLTRIANSILRGNKNISEQDALTKAECLFSEMINKLIDEFSSDIKNLYYMFEEKRSERDQIKAHKLRTNVNSVLFELNNSYKDGWSYEVFETELKKRSGLGAAKVRDVFNKLCTQKEVTERSPGLYHRILGFDRYY